jgi:putative tryptophan/tyrosine transport system substrate-binding protein
MLMPSTAAGTANLVAAFEQGLLDLGYQRGRNIVVEYRFTDGRAEKLTEFAAELEKIGVAVIVTTTDAVVRTVAEQTRSVPIVMVNTADPIGNGLVKTLAQPSGRITGLTNFSPEISAKRVELLKQAVPGLTAVAYLWSSEIAGALPVYEEVEIAARRLGLHVQALEVQQRADVERMLARFSMPGPAGLLVQAPNPMLYTERALICRLAAAQRLPSMFNRVEYLAAGGLMSYGPNVPAMFHRAAAYVDKILKAARPATLPVEQPTSFELALNLRTMRALGIDVPPALVARVDRVID